MSDSSSADFNASVQPVIDWRTFGELAELMEDQLGALLLRHVRATDQYLQTIQAALKADDYLTARAAVHPLKSSHQQIGAVQVAAIAAQIENLCAAQNPDKIIVHELAGILAGKLQETQDILRERSYLPAR